MTRFAMLLPAVLLVLSGCADLPMLEPAPDRTGGVHVRILLQKPEGVAELLLVDRQGRLYWGGGFEALNGDTSWWGDMTDEEIATLLEMLEARSFWSPKPTSSGEPEGKRYSVSLRRQGTRGIRFQVEGDTDAVTPVQEFLAQISLRRLEPFLDTLPQAGE